MLEIALLVVSSLLAAAGAAVLSLRARAAGASERAEVATHARRDDAIVGTISALALLLAVALGHQRGPLSRAAVAAGAWTAGACAAGALAMLAALAARDLVRRASATGRWEAAAASMIGEAAGVVLVLGLLVAVASAASGALSDPQHLAAQVPEMVAGFAVGSAAVAIGSPWSEGEAVASEVATAACAAMMLASYFFDANAGMLRSAPSYASALGLVVFPVVVVALGAFGSAVAAILSPRLESRALPLSGLLVLPAAWGAAAALLGWLWQPFALCATMGVAATLVPHLVATRLAKSPWMDAAALAALAVSALASFAVARHTGLVHAGPFGLAVAAAAAQATTLLARASARADSGERTEAALADRQAATLAAIAIGLAVLDGATLFRCSRFVHAASAPSADTAAMLAHCALADVAPARIDVANPVTLFAALGALVLGATVRPESSLTSRARSAVLAVFVVAATAVVAHYAFGAGVEAVSAAAMAIMIGAALFPAVFPRGVAQLVAAVALAIGAVIG